jgi:hypothetical protein
MDGWMDGSIFRPVRLVMSHQAKLPTDLPCLSVCPTKKAFLRVPAGPFNGVAAAGLWKGGSRKWES